MPSKSRSIERDVRHFDKLMKRKSFETYAGMMQVFVSAYPEQVANKVMGSLRARDFEGLLRWADSYGGALHSTALEAFKANQLVALIKKYPFPAPDLKPKAYSRAIEKFRAAEERCARYNLKFLNLKSRSRFRISEDILHRMNRWITYVIGDEPDLKAIYAKCDFGPGASIGVHGNTTNLARKLMSEEWTCTPAALPFAVEAMWTNQHIAEFILGNTNGYVCLDALEFRKKLEERVRRVHYNKIVTVPKTTLVDRTIAVEPLLNGYLQKGTDEFLRRRLKRVGIDLSDQGKNQRLARLGSTESHDPFITIDLSSASDSISKELVKELVSPEWYRFLDAIRSPAYKFDDSETSIRYHKFVSMGNGFCFPLETLIFASVCRLYCGPTDFSVYGDDIIVRQSVAHKVIKTLWAIGFRHNLDKTFLMGPFRESCGADWFAGRDIRPLTLDYELDSLNSLIKFHNMSKSKPLWGQFFDLVREYLIGLVPMKVRLQRPYPGEVYGAFEVELDIFQSCPFSSWNREIQAWSWYELRLSTLPDRLVERHGRYPTVLVMAAVRGSPSHAPFAKRRTTSQSVRRKSYAGAVSNWLPTL